eukprot:gene1962-23003_t
MQGPHQVPLGNPPRLVAGPSPRAVEWTADHIHFVVDGYTIHTTKPGDSPDYGGPTKAKFFDIPYYILLNTAVGTGGSWAGPPDANTVFP